MRILLCNTTDTGGGAASAACRLLDSLVSMGASAKMLVLTKKSQHPHILSVDEVLHEDKIKTLKRNLKRKLNFYYTSFRWSEYKNKRNIALNDVFISFIGNSLNYIGFDILHLHWVEGGFINFKELQELNKPILWTIHGSFPFTGICHHLLCDKYKTRCGACPALGSRREYDFSTENFELKRKRYKKLNLHIVSPSHFMAEHARESKLLGNRPIHVIPNGINTVTFFPRDKKAARKLLNIADKTTLLFGAYRAIADENKGFDLLLDGLRNLQKYYKRSELQILIFGGTYTGDMFFETVNLGLIDNEELLSTVYSSADVMIVPSKLENLPYTVMESFACATPVVAFEVGGIPELIDHKQNGYLAKPFDTGDLADGILWSLGNNSNNQLGINARKKVLDNFSIQMMASRYDELYKMLLNISPKAEITEKTLVRPNMELSLNKKLKKNKITYLLLYPFISLRRNIARRKENLIKDFLKDSADAVMGGSLIVRVPDFRGIFELDVRSHILHFILVYRDYEHDIVKLIEQYTDPEKDILDVGANIGLHSVLFTRLIKTGSKVLAIEPAPNALKYLEINLKRNKCREKVIVYKGIAADSVNQYELNTIEGMEEYSTLGNMNHPNVSGMKKKSILVQGNTIDNLVNTYMLNPGFIKIDTEGAEFKVLSGAREIIKVHRPIILSELSEKLLHVQGSSCEEVYNLLKEYNYKILDTNTLKPVCGPVEGEILAIPG